MLDWKVRRFNGFENSIDTVGAAPRQSEKVGPVRNQSARLHIDAVKQTDMRQRKAQIVATARSNSASASALSASGIIEATKLLRANATSSPRSKSSECCTALKLSFT